MAIKVNTIEWKDLKVCISDIMQWFIAMNWWSWVWCPNPKIPRDTWFSLNSTTLWWWIAFVCYSKWANEKPWMATVCVDSSNTVNVSAWRNIIIKLEDTYIEDPKAICDSTDLEQGLWIWEVLSVTDAELANTNYYILLYTIDSSGVAVDQRDFFWANSQAQAKMNSCEYIAWESLSWADFAVMLDPVDNRVYRANCSDTDITPNGTSRKSFLWIVQQNANPWDRVLVQFAWIVEWFTRRTAWWPFPDWTILSVHNSNTWYTWALWTAWDTIENCDDCVVGTAICWDKILLNSSWSLIRKQKILSRLCEIEDLVDVDPCLMLALENIDEWDAVASNWAWWITKADANGWWTDLNFIGFAKTTANTWGMVEVQTSWIFPNPDWPQWPNWSVAYLSWTAWNVSTTPSAFWAVPIWCFVCDNSIEIDKSAYLQSQWTNPCDLLDYSYQENWNNSTSSWSFTVSLPHSLWVVPSCIEFKSRFAFNPDRFSLWTDIVMWPRDPLEWQRCNWSQRTCSHILQTSNLWNATDLDFLTLVNGWVYFSQYSDYVRLRVTWVTATTITLEINRFFSSNDDRYAYFDTYIKVIK